ncbi:redoxin domain-containing protein [Paenibacillus alvei]|uniref:Redoxin domain-containing protein n=2 Tax=Paenibacillus alvei TaxID=44250 RepID=A0ABT4H3X9_PAEAL|nr:redoxin domain-containing protein [Paenibacillus alvei]EJW15390.1 antioxidant, AhpC/TSA family [Paenibacillus alvei DSM 29]MCY9706431.1 redoxin domain-containing protein [Paenibacillus alvei]MCY9736356.1 redoxin domain-containing protein [Paenibacillus alvei]MCY9753266.1 redoxin domain-containing protein [Paenibacillus alvei]MCY9763344.1 redoxin domain-containing protein [Paenibacillus alvei]
MTDFIIIITLLLVLIQLLLIFMLARLIGQFLTKIKSVGGISLTELQIGEQVPLFREWGSQGRKVILRELLNHRKVLLLFISTTCQTCKSILPDLERVVENWDIHIVVINTDKQSNDEEIQAILPSGIEYVRSVDIMDAYGVSKVPYAFLVNQNGILESHHSLMSSNMLWNMLENETASSHGGIPGPLSVMNE